MDEYVGDQLVIYLLQPSDARSRVLVARST